MTTYYVDPAASNTSPYDTWAKAATTLQVAADLAVAADIVYCRGTETLTARVDFDTNGGTNAAGFIKFIGCNAAGNVDGTRYNLNCNGGSFSGLYFTGAADMVWMENFEVHSNAGSNPLINASAYASSGCVFVNVCARNGANNGWTGVNFINAIFWRCVAYSNGADGFSYGQSQRYFFSTSRDNTSSGWDASAGTELFSVFHGCITSGNTDDGIGATGQGTTYINCVIDGNTDDGVVVSAQTAICTGPLIVGCRITNHSGAGDIGLNCNSDMVVTAYNYLEDNDGNNLQNDSLHFFIPIEGGSTTSNAEDQADTDEGYVDRAGKDFATRYVDGTDPTLRRTAITVPWS